MEFIAESNLPIFGNKIEEEKKTYDHYEMNERKQSPQNLRDKNQAANDKFKPVTVAPMGGKINLKKMIDKAIKKDQYFNSFNNPTIQQTLSLLKPGNVRHNQVVREPTILGRLSSLTNFDYLGMRNP